MKKLLATLALLVAFALPVAAQDSLLTDVATIRNTYPDIMTREQAAEMLNSVASRHPGWGMLQKGSGNSCPLPGGVYIACDILIHKGPTDETSIHYDVASGADFGDDAHGRNMQPVFNSDGPCVLSPVSGCSMTKFLLPLGYTPPPVDPVKPVTTTTVSPVPPAVLEFMAAVAGALDSEQAKLDAILLKLDAVLGQIAALKAHVDELPATQTVPSLGKITFPVYKATIFGQAVTLTPQAVK